MDDESSVFARLVSEGDLSRVKSNIEEKYGFTPTDEYIIDLMAFVTDMVSRATDESNTSGDDDQDKADE